MNNLRGLLGIRRMDKVPYAQIREMCKVMKGVNERTDEGVLRWFTLVERIENDRIVKRVYVRECAGIRSVGSYMKPLKGGSLYMAKLTS